MNKETPLQRLEKWLKKEKLPKDAKRCIENFVLSCDDINSSDIFNFFNIDINNFSDYVKGRLATGFYYAYSGLNCFQYYHDKGRYYCVCLN